MHTSIYLSIHTHILDFGFNPHAYHFLLLTHNVVGMLLEFLEDAPPPGALQQQVRILVSIYLSIYICVYVCMHGCMDVCTYLCIYISTCLYILCMYIYIYIDRWGCYRSSLRTPPPGAPRQQVKYTLIPTCAYMYLSICIYVSMYVCIYLYIYASTYLSTYLSIYLSL